MSLDVHGLPHTTLEPLCADSPDTFFPPGNDWGEGVNLAAQIDAAKAICARCPLLVPCAEWALTVEDRFAIIAGMLPAERRKERRRREGKPAHRASTCRNNHDTSAPDARDSVGRCRKCRREREARRKQQERAEKAA